MKFGKKLRQRLKEEWAEEYINYKNLKQLLKKIFTDIEFTHQDCQNTFMHQIELEMHKINAFFLKQIGELENLVRLLLGQCHQELKGKHSSKVVGRLWDVLKTAVGEVEEDEEDEPDASSDKSSERVLLEDVEKVERRLDSLRTYVTLNYLGFEKIFRKFYKRTGVQLDLTFASLIAQPFYFSLRLGKLLTLVECARLLLTPASGDITPNDVFQCAICLEGLRAPVILSCAHRFCNGCYKRHEQERLRSAAAIAATTSNVQQRSMVPASASGSPAVNAAPGVPTAPVAASPRVLDCPVCRRVQSVGHAPTIDDTLCKFLELLPGFIMSAVDFSEAPEVVTSSGRKNSNSSSSSSSGSSGAVNKGSNKQNKHAQVQEQEIDPKKQKTNTMSMSVSTMKKGGKKMMDDDDDDTTTSSTAEFGDRCPGDDDDGDESSDSDGPNSNNNSSSDDAPPAPGVDAHGIETLTDFEQLLKHGGKGTYIVLDIDETIITNEHNPCLLLSRDGLGAFNNCLKTSKGQMSYEDRMEVRDLYHTNITAFHLCQPRTVDVIRQLQASGAMVFGLTARQPAHATQTRSDLLRVGVDLRLSSPFPAAFRKGHSITDDLTGAVYVDGVLYSGRERKGIVLRRFLDLLSVSSAQKGREPYLSPKSVVFVDDQYPNLLSVKRWLNGDGAQERRPDDPVQTSNPSLMACNVTCFHYTRATHLYMEHVHKVQYYASTLATPEAAANCLGQDILKLQLQKLFFEKQIIGDDEAIKTIKQRLNLS